MYASVLKASRLTCLGSLGLGLDEVELVDVRLGAGLVEVAPLKSLLVSAAL